MTSKEKHSSDSDDDYFEDAVDDMTHHAAKETISVETRACEIGQSNIENAVESKETLPIIEKQDPKSNEMNSNELDVLLNQDKSDDSCSESDDSEETPDSGDHEKLSSTNTEDILAEATKEPCDGDKQKEKSPEITIDEEAIREQEALLTEEEREARRTNAQEHKEEGNQEFKHSNFEAAIEKFTSALTICPMCYAKERSIFYSNRGACKYRLEQFEACIADSSKALELNPRYLKALLRRAECLEKTEKLDEALEDYTKALEMDPSLRSAREACMRLPDQIKERNEKMKEEMLGKLKDLGNMVLRPFGLSTNNFQMQQNESGGYSVNFVNNPDNGNRKS